MLRRWFRCPTHKQYYPEGSTCYSCELEEGKVIPELKKLEGSESVFQKELSEELKNKIYRLAYLVPKTHPDPLVEKAYKEVIKEIEGR